MSPPPPCSTLFPYTTLFRSLLPHDLAGLLVGRDHAGVDGGDRDDKIAPQRDAAVAVELLLRSEEHTSELQSHHDLVCRLLLEKKHTTSESHRRCRRRPVAQI